MLAAYCRVMQWQAAIHHSHFLQKIYISSSIYHILSIFIYIYKEINTVIQGCVELIKSDGKTLALLIQKLYLK